MPARAGYQDLGSPTPCHVMRAAMSLTLIQLRRCSIPQEFIIAEAACPGSWPPPDGWTKLSRLPISSLQLWPAYLQVVSRFPTPDIRSMDSELSTRRGGSL